MIRWADTFILNSDWLLASERVKLFAMVAKTKALKLKNPMQCRRSLKIHLKISEAQKRHSFAHLWSVQSNTIVKYPLGFPWETDARKSHHSIHTQRYKDSYITLLQYIVLPCWSHKPSRIRELSTVICVSWIRTLLYLVHPQSARGLHSQQTFPWQIV